MRTTLTLDPDVAQSLRARVAERKASFKQIVNEALRRGLAAEPARSRQRPFRVKARALGLRPGIDPEKLNQLLDELEVQEFAAQAGLAKSRR